MKGISISRHPVLLLSIVFAWILGCGCRTSIHNPPIPKEYDQKKLVDIWLGFTEAGSAYYLLELGEDHRGLLLTELWDGSISAYPIKEWRVDTDTIRCRFERTSENKSPASLECTIKLNQLLGKLRGVGGWEEYIFLRRSRSIEESLSRLRKELEAHPKPYR